MKQGVTPHACTPFDVTRHLGPSLFLMLMLMLSLAACGRQAAAPVSGSAALRDPQGFILGYDPQSGDAVTPPPDQESDATTSKGDLPGNDTTSGSSTVSKEEALNRILEKVGICQDSCRFVAYRFLIILLARVIQITHRRTCRIYSTIWLTMSLWGCDTRHPSASPRTLWYSPEVEMPGTQPITPPLIINQLSRHKRSLMQFPMFH